METRPRMGFHPCFPVFENGGVIQELLSGVPLLMEMWQFPNSTNNRNQGLEACGSAGGAVA